MDKGAIVTVSTSVAVAYYRGAAEGKVYSSCCATLSTPPESLLIKTTQQKPKKSTFSTYLLSLHM